MNARSLSLVIILAVVGLPGLACKQAPTEQPKQAEQVVRDKLEEITVVDTEEKAIEIVRRGVVTTEQPKQAEQVVKDKLEEITVVDTGEKAIEIARRELVKMAGIRRRQAAKITGKDCGEQVDIRVEYRVRRWGDGWRVLAVEVPETIGAHCLIIISNKGEVIKVIRGQ